MNDFRTLAIRHYKAIVKRGKISKETTFADFLEKLHEESFEMVMAYDDSGHKLTPEVVQEGIDTVATIINMFTHNNIDFVAEFEKNVIHQETRDN